MFDAIFDKLADTQVLLGLLIAIAAGAAVLSAAMPLLEPDRLGNRMKAMATERERIRARERERLGKGAKGSLRPEAKAFMTKIVDQFKVSQWLGTEKAKLQLARAGFRSPSAETAFLFFRLVAPVGFFVLAVLYLFVITDFQLTLMMKLAIVLGAVYLGVKAPEISLSNTTSKRQKSLRRAFPDTLDLMLICVESGMSLEHACRKVSQEIGTQSVPMAEELTVTTAELSFLSDRRLAFENLANRTAIDSIKSLTTVLIQAERYGTPLGAALRVLAQESRDLRMLAAEKKAASLPPKLTVPMILFFLPVLFVIIGTPAAIQIANSAVSR